MLSEERHTADIDLRNLEFRSTFAFNAVYEPEIPESVRKEAFIAFMEHLRENFPDAEFEVGDIDHTSISSEEIRSSVENALQALLDELPANVHVGAVRMGEIPNELTSHNTEVTTYLSADALANYDINNSELSLSEEQEREIRKNVSEGLKARVIEREADLENLELKKNSSLFRGTTLSAIALAFTAYHLTLAAVANVQLPVHSLIHGVSGAVFAAAAYVAFSSRRTSKHLYEQVKENIKNRIRKKS